MHNINTNILCQANWHDRNTYFLLGIVLAALSAASVVGVILERREKIGVESALVHRFNHKLKVWWMMIVIFALGFLLYRIGIVILFGLVSFWALREFITMTPTRRGDHRSLFWVFFIFTPLQYILIALGSDPPSFLGGAHRSQ